MKTSPDAHRSVRCTESGCGCESFRAGVQLRSCDRCGHGWVAHALQRLQAPPPSSCSPAEVALPGRVLDLSSLVLYGAQAVPVRLKILLDRLYSVLTSEQVGHILQALGWTAGDYVRGYVLQRPGETVLDRWSMVAPEEEPLVLRQFLRFGETRPIVELMALSDATLRPLGRAPTPPALQNGRGPPGRPRCADGFSAGLPLPLPPPPPPLPFSGSAFRRLTPPPKGDARRSRPTPPRPQRPGVTTLTQDLPTPRPQVDGEDDDGRDTPPSVWGPRPLPEQETERPAVASSPPPPPPPAPSSLRALPSFSSSFLCAPPTSSSFSSSLQPLPSSLCSAPPPSSSVGGRKGRVCCGVCGKSFYDKGTLKIHYNAVHLRIKHGCTVAGCSMVFSSLRSRNRHSANPNPRLHTGAGRAALHQAHLQGAPRGQAGPERVRQLRDLRLGPPPRRPSPPPPPSPLPAPLSAAQSVERHRSRPGYPTVTAPTADHKTLREACGGPTGDPRRAASDGTPKKKPRKSSTPVKIEREATECR